MYIRSGTNIIVSQVHHGGRGVNNECDECTPYTVLRTLYGVGPYFADYIRCLALREG